MRKCIWIMLLAGACGSASAAWEQVGANKEFTGYGDPATIRKAGNMVQMWVMHDYKKAQVFEGRAYLSVREHYEYDCKDGRLQLLAIVANSENLAKGRVVHKTSFDYEDWQPVRRGTMNETLWKFACGKR